MLYHIVILLLATLGIVGGFRKGLARQTPKFIGFCFGVLCAHIFRAPVEEAVRSVIPWFDGTVKAPFAYSVLTVSVIFLAVYEIFGFVTGFLKYVISPLGGSILDSIAGAAFMLFRYMMMISIVYNAFLCVKTDSTLLRYAKSDDGNIVEETMLLAPAVLGGEDVEDLAHAIQLEEAKRIS